jgi:hypothetical protein
VGRAKQLNLNHPASYRFTDFYNVYRQGDDRGALNFALKVKLKGHPLAPMFIAAASGQLGEADAAAKAVREFLAVRPDFAVVAREECRKWWEPDLVEQIIYGLRKAGVEIATERNPQP